MNFLKVHLLRRSREVICGLALDGKTIGMCTSQELAIDHISLGDTNSGQTLAKCKSSSMWAAIG